MVHLTDKLKKEIEKIQRRDELKEASMPQSRSWYEEWDEVIQELMSTYNLNKYEAIEVISPVDGDSIENSERQLNEYIK